MDKPFKAIDEQVSILESRGMSTNQRTRDALMRDGYYSIVNGYKDLLIDREETARLGHDVFRRGSTFDELLRLYTFDRDMRLAMFKYFSIAEETLKTVCAYKFSERHQNEAEPYLNAGNYRTDKRHISMVDRLIGDFERALGRDPKAKPMQKAYMEHYLRKHGTVPLWVLMKYMTLGQAFKFFSFQDDSMRNSIASGFSDLYSNTHDAKVRVHDRMLRIAFDHIKDFRNICAHGERLYCARVSPSKDTSISDVMSDLELVLPKRESVMLAKDVVGIIVGAANDLSVVSVSDLLQAMGIEPHRGSMPAILAFPQLLEITEGVSFGSRS